MTVKMIGTAIYTIASRGQYWRISKSTKSQQTGDNGSQCGLT